MCVWFHLPFVNLFLKFWIPREAPGLGYLALYPHLCVSMILPTLCLVVGGESQGGLFVLGTSFLLSLLLIFSNLDT